MFHKKPSRFFPWLPFFCDSAWYCSRLRRRTVPLTFPGILTLLRLRDHFRGQKRHNKPDRIIKGKIDFWSLHSISSDFACHAYGKNAYKWCNTKYATGTNGTYVIPVSYYRYFYMETAPLSSIYRTTIFSALILWYKLKFCSLQWKRGVLVSSAAECFSR